MTLHKKHVKIMCWIIRREHNNQSQPPAEFIVTTANESLYCYAFTLTMFVISHAQI